MGVISSYNQAGGQQLAGQSYSYCIRPEMGMKQRLNSYYVRKSIFNLQDDVHSIWERALFPEARTLSTSMLQLEMRTKLSSRYVCQLFKAAKTTVANFRHGFFFQNCANYIEFPIANSASNRRCGDVLGSVEDDTVESVVTCECQWNWQIPEVK